LVLGRAAVEDNVPLYAKVPPTLRVALDRARDHAADRVCSDRPRAHHAM